MPEHQTRLLAERYELISPLGRGTMGTVWRAHDRALGREVAVKQIRQDPGLTEEQRAELRERMVREGRIAARISHPAVAAIHDVLIHDNSPWIIMELIEARSLEQVIEEEGPLPPRLVAEIGVDLLGALRAAHAQGITHRDVKPGNVLITETGRVVLTDFGIARAEGDPRLTKTGMVIGSPGYTAPERARGDYTGPESDIWSLGATLYFAVEGRPAYERATIAETLAALLSENADPPTQAGQLRPVLNGLLNKDYRQRLSAAQAETMLRMIADTPTSEMPVLTADGAPSGLEPGTPAGRPGQAHDPWHSAPPGPQRPAAPGPPPHAVPGRPAHAGSGMPPHAAPVPPPPAAGPAPYGPGTVPHAKPGPAAQQPGDGFDPDRTMSVARPKPPHGSPPAPHDEGSLTTRRVQVPKPQTSPGQQVYPLPGQPAPQHNPRGLPPHAGFPPAPPSMPPSMPPSGPHAGPHAGAPSMPPPGPQSMPQPGMAPPGASPYGQPGPYDPEPPGLGTDLFAIVGPEQPSGNRKGLLILTIAAVVAVVMAIVIVAVLSSS